jgi:hypothetical protein
VSFAIIRHAGQEIAYANVTQVNSHEPGYLALTHDGYPYRTFHYLAGGRTRVLLAETNYDMHLLLKEGA